MKINKIKKVGQKYKIEFDNKEKLTTYDDVIINNGLLFHPEIDPDILNKITIDHNYYDIYYKVINYITRKLRSEKEVEEFIDKYNVNEKDRQDIIDKLKEIGLINNQNFMKAYISDRFHLSNDGPYKIKKELLEHNLEEDDILNELVKIDREQLQEKLKKLITKKTKNSKYTGYYLEQKIVSELVNLGYSREDIIEIYNQIDKDDSNLLQKEYEKLYKKLSVKYSDKELKYKIKQKLYQKGFKGEDIDKLL